MKNKLSFTAFIPKNISVFFWLVLALLAYIVILYIPVFNNLLTNWDDDLYILENPYLKSLSFQNLKHIFNAFYVGNYHPLTLLSLAVDYQIGGTKPWPYHLTNLLLHLCNTVLVYVFVKSLLQKLSSSVNYSVIALITAGLFGIHTFQVESVAWVSERKNLLYTFFFLASLIMYLKYIDGKSSRAYIFSLVLFLLSLLSKGMAVPLSVCIIVIDYVVGRNLLSGKVMLEKLPYIALSLMFGFVAILAQHSADAISVAHDFTWIDRIAVASYGFVQYLVKLCFPYHLSAFYPYPSKTGPLLPYHFYECIVLVIALLFIVWRYFRQNKVILFGVLFFIVNISIVIQLLPVGDSIMSDRYVYVPSIGFFVIIAYLCAMLWRKNAAFRNGMFTMLILYSALVGMKTFMRVGVWHDSSALWTDAIKNYPENNDRAFLSLGIISYEKGLYPEALMYDNQVLQMHFQNPKPYSKAYLNMGLVKRAMKDRHGAMDDYNKSLACYLSYEGYYNRALLKIEFGDLDSAMVDLDKASQIDPFNKDAYTNKGAIFYQKGNYTEASRNFNRVLQLDPENSNAYLMTGSIKLHSNDMQGALDSYNAALSFAQTYNGYVIRAALKMTLKDYEGALTDLDKALQIDSTHSEIFNNRGICFYEKGDYINALRNYNRTLQMNPHDCKVYLGRGQTKRAMADMPGAMSDFNTALSLNPSYDGYLNRASLKFVMKDFEGALNDLEKATQDSVGYEAYFDKGFINLNIGKMRDAIKAFNKAIEINKTDFDAYLKRGIAKYNLKDYPGTLSDLDHSIQLKPVADAYYYRGMIKILVKQKPEGCEDLKKSASMGSKQAEDEIQKNCKTAF